MEADSLEVSNKLFLFISLTIIVYSIHTWQETVRDGHVLLSTQNKEFNYAIGCKLVPQKISNQINYFAACLLRTQ